MNYIKEKLKSVRVRLFVSLCVVVAVIVIFLIVINNVVLESFYLYSKIKNVKLAYEKINYLYYKTENEPETGINLEDELYEIASKNDFDILVMDSKNITLYCSDKNLNSLINRIDQIMSENNGIKYFSEQKMSNGNKILYQDNKTMIRRIKDERNNMNYIFLSSTLDNGNILYIRIQLESIKESVQISNKLLIFIGGISIIIASVLASFISKKFTKPILELNEIAKNMSKLDFSKKYETDDTDDEINNLGKSINLMSEKLESTIKQLRETNKELEKDIEEKSQIDEMRKQFISDVSHELKTPIALIQGYSEGLIENVNSDEESKTFYAEVIHDEAEKMDLLVKQLLELMKLEYGKREFNNTNFDIVELIKDVVKRCNVMIKERNIVVNFEENKSVYVTADSFYIDQVVTNYLTNAIKHADEINGKKEITIGIEEKENDKIRIKVFNIGDQIPEDELDRIWKRFYKIDSSRNREEGGTGIGLSLVKAIMNIYQNKYGVENKEDGVEFYFELNK